MHCLRCGKETVESAVFCEECLKTVAKPLVQSSFLSTHIVLPNRSAAQPARAPKEQKTKEPKPRNKPLRRALFALFLCLVLCAGAVLGVLYYRDRLETAEQQRAELELRVADLEVQTARQQELADFMENELALIEWDGTRLYHTYGCEHLRLENFTAYSLETAVARGYQPCPDCHEIP